MLCASRVAFEAAVRLYTGYYVVVCSLQLKVYSSDYVCLPSGTAVRAPKGARRACSAFNKTAAASSYRMIKQGSKKRYALLNVGRQSVSILPI